MTDPHPAPAAAPLSAAWKGNLVLLLAGCLAALLVLEGFLRLYNPLGVRIRGDRIVLPRHFRETMTNAANPKLAPVIVFSKNSLGFRGQEPPRDFDRHLTLVAVGGSTTECLYLTDGASWPERLGEALAPHFHRLWVNNAGLDGHSTFGHLLLLDQVLRRLRPKVLLFLVGLNDAGRELPTGREVATGRAPLVHRLARHSAIVANALDIGRHLEARELSLGHREVDLAHTPQRVADRPRAQALLDRHRERSLPGYRSRVREMVRLARAHGIEPVLLTQPALYGGERDDVTGVSLRWIEVDAKQQVHGGLAWRILEEYNEVVREVGRSEGVLVVDVARELPKSSRLYYDFVHFADEGAREVARITARALCPRLAEQFPAYVAAPCALP
ncbi:MAG TPA: SGNH/GDSL hydrolase family protein [Vicinamibacteria bacterium]|nr:SGNH/GDSL hydrolase family protein [Vicinamibacteria bacterium]